MEESAWWLGWASEAKHWAVQTRAGIAKNEGEKYKERIYRYALVASREKEWRAQETTGSLALTDEIMAGQISVIWSFIAAISNYNFINYTIIA